MLFHRCVRFLRHLNWATLREVIDSTLSQRLPGLAAEMAYNALLALFPALMTVISAVGLSQSLQATLFNQARLLGSLAPDEVRSLIGQLIADITTRPNRQLFSLSIIAALWIFSGAVSAAMAALDLIHQTPKHQTRPFWQSKLVSLGLTIGTILLLAIASFLVFISDWLVRLIANQSCLFEPGSECQIRASLLNLWQLGRWPIALAIVCASFAFLYRFGPSRPHPLTPILPGAILAALSWAGLSGLFRLYVAHFGNYNRIYGTIGTIIILQLWLYLSSLVMLMGAQINVAICKSMQRPQRLRKTQLLDLAPSPQPLNDTRNNREQDQNPDRPTWDKR
ncbi:MAG: YihY/virulence factor BrkB family protein [Desertifilum sp. SIO1I2]|nr:YihY/virulence factor BrkB family protein [Desertifilum sp. SIO1I2]